MKAVGGSGGAHGVIQRLKDMARKLLWNEQASDDREGHLRAPEHL